MLERMGTWFSGVSAVSLGFGILFLFAATVAVGFYGGKKNPNPQASELFPSTLLGLLALLLSFTFSMAVGRYEDRRKIVVNEANAIGTAFLRADTLPQDEVAHAKELIRQYVQNRIEFFDSGEDAVRFDKAVGEGNKLTAQLWARAATLAKTDRTPVMSLYLDSLNNFFDLGSERLLAVENHVPHPLFSYLVVLAVVALAALRSQQGQKHGLQKQSARALPYVLAILIASAITLARDLDSPRSGMIQVSQTPMLLLLGAVSR